MVISVKLLCVLAKNRDVNDWAGVIELVAQNVNYLLSFRQRRIWDLGSVFICRRC